MYSQSFEKQEDNNCGVFFICKSKQIFKTIRAVDKKYYAQVPSKIPYMTLEECKNATDVLNFYDRDGEKLFIEKLSTKSSKKYPKTTQKVPKKLPIIGSFLEIKYCAKNSLNKRGFCQF